MIDETLTLGRAEQRIGDIVQKSTNILYPESPITIHWKTILALRDMLINEKLIKNILQLKKIIHIGKKN